jgi:hypothetical protein
VGAIFTSLARELSTMPKISKAKSDFDAPIVVKLPTAAELKKMGARFAAHVANLEALIADVKILADSDWPLTDPDYQGNLCEQLAPMLEPIDFQTDGAAVVEFNMTLQATLDDVFSIAEDLNPGPEQGKWARAILEASEATGPQEGTRLSGTATIQPDTVQ